MTVKHEDVVGFMAAMTMPFAVKEPRLLDGIAVGDLIQATLMVTDQEAWLTDIRKVGTGPPSDRSSQPARLTVDDIEPGAPVPEPASLALFGFGLGAWAVRRRRRAG